MEIYEKIKSKTAEVLDSIDWEDIDKKKGVALTKADEIRQEFLRKVRDEKERRLNRREVELKETEAKLLDQSSRLGELENALAVKEELLEKKKYYPHYIILSFCIIAIVLIYIKHS